MTIKEFRKILRSEKATLNYMLNGGTLSYSVVYKAVDELKAACKKIKKGKIQNQLMYDLCSYETSMIEKIEKGLKKYKCVAKEKETGNLRIFLSSEGQNKKSFIYDIRANGYSINNLKVKQEKVFDWICDNTNAEIWHWQCLNTEKDIEQYKKEGSDFIDRKLS
jgi:hypothetical protein